MTKFFALKFLNFKILKFQIFKLQISNLFHTLAPMLMRGSATFERE